MLDDLSRLFQAVKDALEARNHDAFRSATSELRAAAAELEATENGEAGAGVWLLALSSERLEDFASQERPSWEEAKAAASFAETGLDIAMGRAPTEPRRPPGHETCSFVLDVPVGEFARLATALAAAEVDIADVDARREEQSDARIMRTRLSFDEQADVAPVLEALGWHFQAD